MDPLSVGLGAFPVFVVLSFALVIVVGILGYRANQARQRRLQTFAAGIGWQYSPAGPGLETRFTGAPFGIGSSRRATSVLTGTFSGHQALVFDYQYTTGSGDDESTTHLHVLCLSLPAYLPRLELTPDGVGAKIAKRFGAGDVNLESDAFNRMWRVAAPSPKFATDVLHPRLMEYLLHSGTEPFRIDGTDIISWIPGQLDTERMAGRLARLAAVVESIPRFVWLDCGYDPLDIHAPRTPPAR